MNSCNQLLEALRDVIGATSLSLVNEYMRIWNCSAYNALLETHIVPEEELADLLAQYYQLPRLHDLHRQMVDTESLKAWPFDTAMRTCSIPVEIGTQSFLVVAEPAMQEILNLQATRSPKFLLMVASATDIRRVIPFVYPVEEIFEGVV